MWGVKHLARLMITLVLVLKTVLQITTMWQNLLPANALTNFRHYCIGSCESLLCVRIESAVRFDFESNFRIGRIYHASRNTI